MNLASFRALRDPLESAYDAACDAVRAVPGVSSGPMGLTPDAVKACPDFRAADAACKAADARLRAFDKAFTRQLGKTWPVYFKKELRAETDARRAAWAANREASQ